MQNNKKFFNVIIFIIIIGLLTAAVFYYRVHYKADVPQSSSLSQATLIINNATYSVQVATSAADQEKGLSGRTSLPQNQGMLFLFSQPTTQFFWMKDMKIPLDIVWISAGKVVDLSPNLPVPTNNSDPNLPTYAPKVPITGALEINAGQIKTHQFQIGQTVTLK